MAAPLHEPPAAISVSPPEAVARTHGLGAWRRLLRVAPLGWPAAIWLTGLLVCRAWHEELPYRSAALWGLLLLGSFVAWGAALLHTLIPSRAFGWGFEGSVGLALTLLVLGSLACFRMVSVSVIAGWAATGPIALCVVRFRSARGRRSAAHAAESSLRYRIAGAGRRLLRRSSLAFATALAALYAMAALQYVQSVTDTHFNVYDDEMAYRSFARQFLDTGTLFEPFSFRRIGGYGGQALGQAMALALSDRDRVHMFDGGICLLLILGLVTGFRSSSRSSARPAILGAGLLAMTIPFSPHNLASELSGCVFFLALFRLFDAARFEQTPAGANIVLIGLLTAAACTLRQNYIPAAVALVALNYLALFAWPGATRGRIEWLKQGVAALGATGLCLVPWMLLLYAADRTPLYPLLKGNMTPDFGFVGTVSRAELLRWTLENLFYFFPFSTIALLFLAACALPANRTNRPIHAFLFASTGAFGLMMYFFQAFDKADSIARYYFAFIVPFAIAVALRAVAEASSASRIGGAFMAGAAATVAIGVHFVGAKDIIRREYTERITALEDFWHQQGHVVFSSDADQLYRRIQESIPAGEPILVMLDHAYLLDERRNRIFDYDHPGAIGLAGGPPVFQGAEAFARYMHSLGIHYIAYQLGSSSPEYQWELWQRRSQEVPPKNGRGGFYKNQARFELDFFNVLASLSASRASVFRQGDVNVLSLESRTQ